MAHLSIDCAVLYEGGSFMDALLENASLVSLSLGLGSAFGLAMFVYNKTRPPKSFFRQPTKHIEIHSWKIK